MLHSSLCKQILNEGERTYTDREVALIAELLWQWAQLTVETLEEIEKERE